MKLGPQDIYVLDASMDASDMGMFCFCPVELDDNGEVKSIIVGMNYISTEPPENSKFLGVVHEEGQGACDKWCKEHDDLILDLRKRFGDLKKDKKV